MGSSGCGGKSSRWWREAIPTTFSLSVHGNGHLSTFRARKYNPAAILAALNIPPRGAAETFVARPAPQFRRRLGRSRSCATAWNSATDGDRRHRGGAWKGARPLRTLTLENGSDLFSNVRGRSGQCFRIPQTLISGLFSGREWGRIAAFRFRKEKGQDRLPAQR